MNRVVISKLITVASVNGAAATVIEGYPVEGDSAVRCVYVGDGATVTGFTLTNGATGYAIWWGSNYRRTQGGGAWCEPGGVISNCVVTGNSAYYLGGGTYGGTLFNCTLASNSVPYGNGGGSCSNRLVNCTLIGNSASSGGGAFSCFLSGCTVSKNSAYYGGGAFSSTLESCAVVDNQAVQQGGGTWESTLNHCTLTGNQATYGGGSYGGFHTNSIIYYNSTTYGYAPDGPNYSSGNFHHCCTIPLPATGLGNFTTEPRLADAAHLALASPCRGAGDPASAAGADIDGDSWLNPPAVGCDEYQAGTPTGALGVSVQATFTNVATGFRVNLTSQISGIANRNIWDFGDGTMATNSPYVSHAWASPGDYTVQVTAYNNSSPDGVSAKVAVHVESAWHYVALNSAAPAAPYNSWASAATNIQDAVDASWAGSSILVSNGVFETGGRAIQELTNRLVVNKPVTVCSVNGPATTTIKGYCVPGTSNGASAIRCVYLAHDAVLSGFTLTNGATIEGGGDYYSDRISGGGVYCEWRSAMVSNCVIIGNYADFGGGAALASLNNCLLVGNAAFYGGGGAKSCVLNNCTLVSNSIPAAALTRGDGGGGASEATLNNCVLYLNNPSTNADCFSCTLNYCCTAVLPTNGMGNITNDPVFVDPASGNYHLQSNSPCINAGNNSYVTLANDLDGNPRIIGGTVDMGAYEAQSPALLAYYSWLQGYSLPTDAASVYADTDGDRMNNWQEYLADTSPLNGNDFLHITSFTRSGTYNTLWWTSKPTRLYQVQRRESLAAASPWETIITNAAPGWNNVGFDNTGPQHFYRIQAVQP